MTLSEKQQLFARLFAGLIREALRQGFQLTLGEVWRPAETARLYAEKGIGTPNSLHISRLAADINLFRDGQYLTRSEDYVSLGVWWETRHPLCRWGGRFTRPDGNHFSLTHEGRS